MESPCPAQGWWRRDRSAVPSARFARRLLVVFALLGAIVGPTAHPVGAAQTATVDADALNVRADPGTWAAIVGQTALGQPVSVLAGPTPDGWYQIAGGGVAGWVHGWYLSFGGALGWAAPTDAIWAVDPNAAALAPPGQTPGQAPAGVGGPTDAGWSSAAVPEPGGLAGGPWQETWQPQPVERWVDINRTTQTVSLYEGGQAIGGFWGAMGIDRSDAGFFATANGTYWVYEKYADLSWTDYGQAWVRNWIGFDPNRLNGFHSYSMDWAGQILPDGAGPTGGCVALHPDAAARLFAFVQLGTRVEVHW